MDATVNDFLSEIDEIAPPKKEECAWQECFDDGTGFPYYWHMHTNEVTWEMPAEYSKWLTQRPPAKIYKIESDAKNNGETKKPAKKPNSDSEDEKIVLISSYGGDTESEEEEEKNDKSVHNLEAEEKIEPPKSVTGFSLLAAYADSEEEDDEQEELVAEEKVEEVVVAHSTLFPIVKPIDVNQFAESTDKEVEVTVAEEISIDTKAFQRKRRIAVDLINNPKIVKSGDDDEDANAAPTGLGYKSGDSNKTAPFGKIAFVKSDVLNANQLDKQDDITDIKNTLQEKLSFLSEANAPVSPVQVMLIQMQTLYAALKSGSLSSSYLSRWLTETSEELVKLEEEAAPVGWLLKWDRSQKRYYYRNRSTDECQWDYPGSETAGSKGAAVAAATERVEDEEEEEEEEDDMDICTTPPPPADSPSTPSATPSPPPAPSITDGSKTKTATKDDKLVQPLPPGVETNVDSKNPKQNDLNSVLNSFYSDIAALEKPPADGDGADASAATSDEPAKKKKKIKMTQSISMKKKSVSKLVEKWKNVQKDLD